MHNWIKRHKDRIPVYVVVIASVLFGYMVYIRRMCIYVYISMKGG